MAYPEPILLVYLSHDEGQMERNYKESRFFYDQYENAKKELRDANTEIGRLLGRLSVCHDKLGTMTKQVVPCDCEDCVSMRRLLDMGPSPS